jgi:hypothetical protein
VLKPQKHQQLKNTSQFTLLTASKSAWRILNKIAMMHAFVKLKNTITPSGKKCRSVFLDAKIGSKGFCPKTVSVTHVQHSLERLVVAATVPIS